MSRYKTPPHLRPVTEQRLAILRLIFKMSTSGIRPPTQAGIARELNISRQRVHQQINILKAGGYIDESGPYMRLSQKGIDQIW